MTTTDTRRADFIQSLHDLADALGKDPNLPLPHDGTNSPLLWFVHDNLDQALALRDLMTDSTTEHDTSVAFPVTITGRIGALRVTVYVAAKLALLDPATTTVPRWPACDPRLGLDAKSAVSL